MAATVLGIDLETYSSVDLAKAGVYRYAEADDFRVLLLGYSINGGESKVVELADGEPLPREIKEMLLDKQVIKTAYNALFERTCLAKFLNAEMPPEEWRCTLVLAAQAGLPLGLDAVCKALGLSSEEAKTDGGSLLRWFSRPGRDGGRHMPWDDYERWNKFVAYNKRDVEVENTVRKKLKTLRPDEIEQRFWCLDQRINDKGVRLDLDLADKAIEMNRIYADSLTKRMVAISNLANVNSDYQIKNWLSAHEGVVIESLNKKAMPEVLKQIKSDEAKELLSLRAELSKTSLAKYQKMKDCTCSDNHARGLFQFYGASRTGRFAGRLLQLQNLPRNRSENITGIRAAVKAGSYDELRKINSNISTTLSELIRTAIIPEPECRFIVADFSAIEARVIAWFAKENDDLEEFRGAGKIYELTAARMFGVAKERIVKGNPEYALRAKGKVATLACGYGGGPAALIAMGALQSGIAEDDLPELVRQWRAAHPRIVRWWKSLEETARQAIKTKATVKDEVGGIVFTFTDGDLHMVLPSKRRLIYRDAQVKQGRRGTESIIYSGANQTTKQWAQLETYGGKLAENCVQAAARDCLRDAMLRLDAAGFDIRMHVHDEIIINEPAPGRTLEEVIKLMCIPPAWASDLPLSAAGFTAEFYMKD